MFDPKNHFDKYIKINNYKYALEHENEAVNIVKKKLEMKEQLKKLKEKLEREKEKSKDPETIETKNKTEKKLLEYFRQLSKEEQEYFYHNIALKALEKKIK